MQIIEQTGISNQQHNQFIPKERFNIPKATIQKIKSVITSLNSGIVTSDFSNTSSTPYSWVLSANNQVIYDLSQMYFNIACDVELPNNALGFNNEDLNFGNLFMCSLFQTAALDIGGTTIALNRNPGIDANIQAMLKFDQFDLKSYSLADREFMINGLNPNINIEIENMQFKENCFYIMATAKDAIPVIKTTKPWPEYAGKTYYYAGEAIRFITIDAYNYDITVFKATFDDIGMGTIQVYQPLGAALATASTAVAAINTTNHQYTIYGADDKVAYINENCVIPTVKDDGFKANDKGVIRVPLRCKLYLSDLFNYTVDSLDYVFNRDIKITLNRSAISNLICNVSHAGSSMTTVLKVVSTSKFELVAFSYLLTDTARMEMIKAYSQPIETLYGVQTVNLQPLYNDNSPEQNIVLPLTTTYDLKAIIIAIPKCSNTLQPLSTGKSGVIPGQIVDGSVTVNSSYQTSWIYSNSNSYNYGGLKYVRISNTSNSNIYTYDFAGTQEKCLNLDSFLKSFDFKNETAANPSILNDYREPYEQYKQLRLLFGKAPDNGIDYKTFLKDYFIIPVDLTGSNIPPNTRIYLTLQFESFAGDTGYNPLHYGNCAKNQYTSTNILAVYFGSNVLTYNPDGSCTTKNVLSVNPASPQITVTK